MTFLRTILALSAVLALGYASRANAQGLDSCGDIRVEAQAQCEVVAPGAQCTASCTANVARAACSARLVAECDGQCDVTPPAGCTVDCAATCKGECTVDPGKFDCAARCEANCSGECAGKCEASSNRAECEASCEGTCSARCEGGCDVELPEADCDGKCEASCDASCDVEAELDCQIDCQADGSAQCKLDVEGSCKADCETQEGALFCDGQYVDHGDNLKECVAAIEAVIDANVEGYAEGSSSCEDGKCTAKGKAGASCTVARADSSQFGAGAAGLFGAWVLLAARRRRAQP